MINNSEKLSKFMTQNPITVNTQQSLEFANTLMKKNSIRHLPVLEGGKLVGVLSERDIHYLESFEKLDASELTVEDAYSDDLQIVDTDTPVSEACSMMAESKVGSVIVKENKSLVGIFTWIDALKILAH